MGIVVYALCVATSLLCFGMLARGWRATRTPLLLWSSIAFFFFTVGNVLLFVDLIVLPQIDLMIYRNLMNLAGIMALLPRLIRQAVVDRP